MNDQNLDECLELAVRLADAAAPVVMKHFRSKIVIEHKPDQSPVTAADRESEAIMRSLIAKTFPGHGVIGEEQGAKRAAAEYVWVIDPIDGTQSFVTGKPLFGVLISLARNGVPILGIIEAPAMKERWIGVKGRQTTCNGAKVHVRPCPGTSEAWLYATSPHMFKQDDFQAFERLRGVCKRAVYGADCYAYGLLANGFVDLVCEASLKPYDFCALAPIVKGAGGVITDWEGKELTLQSSGRVLAAGDASAHAQGLKALGLKALGLKALGLKALGLKALGLKALAHGILS